MYWGLHMKILHLFIASVLSLLVLAGCGVLVKKELTPEEKAQQGKLAAVLPFEISIDNNQAQLNSEFCAKIANPVSSAAEVLVQSKSDDTIVASIYPSNADGIALAGKQPCILLLGDDGKSSLDKIREGKLKPGFYVINISVGDKIASVVFEVKK